MSSHSALSSVDILHEVFVILRVDVPTDREVISKTILDQRHTLSQAARVCKAFSEPALRALWWALPSSIEPALLLLPAIAVIQSSPGTSRSLSVVGHRRSPVPSYEIRALGEISSGDWARFTAYAAYVRVIYLASRGPIPRDVLDALRAKTRDSPLFPNLQQFSWDLNALHRSDLALFVPPCLQRFIVDAPIPDLDTQTTAHVASLGEAIHDLVGLVELHIRSFPTPTLGPAVEASILRMQHLQVLSLCTTCYVSSTDFLRQLSRLPALRELRLGILLSTEDSQDLTFRGFYALRTLTLRADSELATILPVFCSPSLTSISVNSLARDAAPIPTLLRLVAGAYPALRRVTFEWTQAEATQHLAHDLADFDTVFGPLLRVATMEEFTLHTPLSLFISRGADAELARLAQSWPRLRLLSLNTTLLGPLTHAAVLPLARHCPELRTLHLRSVSFTGLTAEEVAATPVHPHTVNGLYICNALVDYADTSLGAEFLRRVFPDAYVPLDGSCCIFRGTRCDRAMLKLVAYVSASAGFWLDTAVDQSWGFGSYDIMDG